MSVRKFKPESHSLNWLDWIVLIIFVPVLLYMVWALFWGTYGIFTWPR